MKRFAFRLESVLKLRRHELETRQRTLALALSGLADVERTTESASIAASERAAEFSASAKDGVSSQRLGFFQLAVENAFRSWRNSRVSVLAEQMVVTQAREEVVRSHTDVRAIEKLRERAVERYDADCAREEMGLLDEVAGRTRSLAERLSKLPGEREGSRP